MQHRFMTELAAALVARGFAVLRFQFPYMEKGGTRTDAPAIATAAIAAAFETLRAQVPDVPLFAGGKSFGARMTTTAAAEAQLTGVKGLICFGFPLHPSGKPGLARAKHLEAVKNRMLFLQGTRDALADLKLMHDVCAKLSRATIHVVDGADHGFEVLKRSGRTPEDVMNELADTAAKFARTR